MDEIISSILETSPLVLLAASLNVFGFILKRIPSYPNWLIPISLPIIGAIVWTQLGPAVPISWLASVKHPNVVYALVGFVAGGFAVWGHQVIKQVKTKEPEV